MAAAKRKPKPPAPEPTNGHDVHGAPAFSLVQAYHIDNLVDSLRATSTLLTRLEKVQRDTLEVARDQLAATREFTALLKGAKPAPDNTVTKEG